MFKQILKNVLFFFVVFICMKIAFMLYHIDIYSAYSWSDWLEVIIHGLGLDIASAAYLTVIPTILIFFQLWTESKVWHGMSVAYYILVSVALSIIFCSDLVLYGFWGVRLDCSAISYFISSPKDAIASLTIVQLAIGVACVVVIALFLILLCQKLFLQFGFISETMVKIRNVRIKWQRRRDNITDPLDKAGCYLSKNVLVEAPVIENKKEQKRIQSAIKHSLKLFKNEQAEAKRVDRSDIQEGKYIYRPKHRVACSVGVLIVLAILFCFMRGIKLSTRNTGSAYFSTEMRLNHAAVNPCFNVFESAAKSKHVYNSYKYMENEQAEKLIEQLNLPPKTVRGSRLLVADTLVVDSLSADSISAKLIADSLLLNKLSANNVLGYNQKILKMERPNILVIVLEGFLPYAMETMGGEAIAVNMDRFAKEGILFKNFYANSFRTDRGLAAIFSGFPALPRNSLMKIPRKAQNVPAFPAKLCKEGYNLSYWYGGDINFTSQRSYVRSMGFSKIVSDTDFPAKEVYSKWGAHDDALFKKCANEMLHLGDAVLKEPFLAVIQTSSSHEPYEVPFNKFEDKQMNSIAFADSCLGAFIDSFKRSNYWDNTLVILVADHTMSYPDDVDNFGPERYHIPFVLMGGALTKSSCVVNLFGGQIDIAATLLGQMGISHNEFKYSKDIFSPDVANYAFFTYPNIFGMIDEYGHVFYDCSAKSVIRENNSPESGVSIDRGKAFIQMLSFDFDNL